jgi:hypothetical protein
MNSVIFAGRSLLMGGADEMLKKSAFEARRHGAPMCRIASVIS